MEAEGQGKPHGTEASRKAGKEGGGWGLTACDEQL